LILGEIIVVV